MKKNKTLLPLLFSFVFIFSPISSFASSPNVSGRGVVTEEERELTDFEIIGMDWAENSRNMNGNGSAYENFTETFQHVGDIKNEDDALKKSHYIKFKTGYFDERSGRKVLEGNPYAGTFNRYKSCDQWGIRCQWIEGQTTVYMNVLKWGLTEQEKNDYKTFKNSLKTFKNTLSTSEYNKMFSEKHKGYIDEILNTDEDNATEVFFNTKFKVAKYRVQREMRKLNFTENNNNSCGCA